MMNRSVRNLEVHFFKVPLFLGLPVLSWTLKLLTFVLMSSLLAWLALTFVWLLHSDSSLRRKINP